MLPKTFNITTVQSRKSNSGFTFDSVQNRLPDGVVVQGFLDEQELETAKNRITNSDCDIATVAPYGKIIGKKLTSRSGNFQELPLNEYLTNATNYRMLMPDVIGFDFEKRFRDVCTVVFGEKVDVPSIDGLSYIPAAVRCLFPDGGGIIAHVGNEFIEKMPEILALHKIAKPYNQLSFFLVVQLPEEGGNLVLYDATWEETKEMNLSFAETSSIVKQKTRQQVKLKEGDLIIFAGGEIWHEVTPMNGGRDRITVGGFMAPSIEKDKWYFWS